MNEETIAALKKLVDEFYELDSLYNDASEEEREDIVTQQDYIREEVFVIARDNV